MNTEITPTTKKIIRNVNVEHRQRLSKLEKIALKITEKVGSMEFFLIVFAWTVVWFLWNIAAPLSWRFDPFPAFVLWLFISNMIQLFLTPLIMVGQNLQSRHTEVRAETDFEINIKAENEIEDIAARLEKQEKILTEIRDRLDKK